MTYNFRNLFSCFSYLISTSMISLTFSFRLRVFTFSSFFIMISWFILFWSAICSFKSFYFSSALFMAYWSSLSKDFTLSANYSSIILYLVYMLLYLLMSLTRTNLSLFKYISMKLLDSLKSSTKFGCDDAVDSDFTGYFWLINCSPLFSRLFLSFSL